MPKYFPLAIIIAVISSFLHFLYALPAASQEATPSAKTEVNIDTLTQVRDWLAKTLGVRKQDLKRSTNLKIDLSIDRSRLSEALKRLWFDFGVTPPETEMTTISEIARHIEKTETKEKSGTTDSTLRAGRGKAFYIQRVYYATNRRPTGKPEPEVAFLGERMSKGKLNYGFADVNIPRSHKKGRLESPWRGLKIFRDPRQHIYILKLDTLDEIGFFQDLASDTTESDLLVFVHGYNVTFDEAVRRTAQIAVDLEFKGVPITFSWPSDGSVTSYNADWSDAIWSSLHFKKFIESLQTKFPQRKIHVIAHSMGNKVLLHASRLISYSRQKKPQQSRLSTVILCAPDFDANLFSEQLAQEVRPLAHNWVVYTSNQDFTLIASDKFNQAFRLGIPATAAEGIQTIDASEVEVTPWSVEETHSYYAAKKPVIDDMMASLLGKSPEARGLVPREIEGGTVWNLR